MLRGSVTASLIGYVLLMHVKELGQLLIGISSLLEKISRGLYYERMKLSYICTAEYIEPCQRNFYNLLSHVCAPSQDTDQSAHPQSLSLIKVFTVCSGNS